MQIYKSEGIRDPDWWHKVAVTTCWVWPTDWPVRPTSATATTKLTAKQKKANEEARDKFVVMALAAAEIIQTVKKAKSIDSTLLGVRHSLLLVFDLCWTF